LPPPATEPTPSPPPPPPARSSLVAVHWSALFDVTWQQREVDAPWVMVKDALIGTVSFLRLTATGQWTTLAGLPDCGPDGLAGLPFPDDRLVLPDCAVGALIGRIGGSSASVKAAAPATDAGETKPFPIGSFAVLKLPDKVVGPMFLGFNILLRPIRLAALRLTVEGGTAV
jgi:hypothetical protein